ncbi:unnamed protein product [Cuscuta epithymum]|uniref:NAC domain-containing protein n=1 Tax=Cuscuta epithymum TaxID=186058 RepID=A0AAV0CL48_9ASTE|nr:unnamed protein product [Cuscuta epithymum]
MVGNYTSDNLPPGFRFHPTDEELIMYYLRNQATARPCPVSIIPEVDFYKFDPWELPEKAEFGENEWYFFTPRDRKYPNGVRPNRAAVSGYWKATGTDKAIHSGSKYVGVKKALVFYKGRPPKGIKTDWIMHEYRLSDSRPSNFKQNNGSMRLDDWVLCRIYKKKNMGKAIEMKIEEEETNTKYGSCFEGTSSGPQVQGMKLPRACSLTHLLEMDCFGSIPQLLVENNGNFGNQNTFMANGGIFPFTLGEQLPHQYSQSNCMLNQPIFVNPSFQFQ